ncbi:MAG: MFS transporter [Candidatus Dormibacteraeota bacterium]|nr:MFS transporter [Candidatus Dormibacteraeota bacterium]
MAAVPKLSTRSQVLATVGVMLTLFLAAIDQTIVSTALPRIVADLNGFEIYTWVTTAYLVASVVMVPVAGKLGDMFGRKPFLLVGMAGFMASSWLCGFAQNMTELVAFRGVQGLFAGALMANTFTVLADLYTIEQRTRIQGLFGAVFGLASVVGPTLGGYLTDNLSWRWVFYVNVPVGIVALAVVLLALPYVRSAASWREIDFPGAATLAAGIVPLLIGLTITSDHAWTSPEVLSLLAVGAVMLVVFFVVETRVAANPIVPFGLFKLNQFRTIIVVTFITAFGMFGTIIYVPLLYQGVLGISATNSGSFLTPLMLGLIVLSSITGQLLTRIRRYRFLGTFGVAIMIFGIWRLTQVQPDTSRWTVAADLVVIGAGLGVSFPMTVSVIQAALPRALVGVGTSQVQFWRSLGGTVATAVVGSILTNRLGGHVSTRISDLHLPPQAGALVGRIGAGNPQQLFDPNTLSRARGSVPAQLAPVFDQVVGAVRLGLADALHDVFFIVAGILVVALVATVFLREVPIRSREAEPAATPTRRTAGREPAVRLLLAAASYVALRRRGTVPPPVVDLLSAVVDDYTARRGLPEGRPAGDGAQVPGGAPLAESGNGRYSVSHSRNPSA